MTFTINQVVLFVAGYGLSVWVALCFGIMVGRIRRDDDLR